MIGLSLSACVRDIVNGKVDIEDVEMVYCGTKAPSRKAFSKLLGNYAKSYWRKYGVEARRAAMRLWNEGKIRQPRIKGVVAHQINPDNPWVSFQDALLKRKQADADRCIQTSEAAAVLDAMAEEFRGVPKLQEATPTKEAKREPESGN